MWCQNPIMAFLRCPVIYNMSNAWQGLVAYILVSLAELHVESFLEQYQ